MAEGGPPRFSIPLLWPVLAAAAVVVISVLAAVLLTPAISPIPAIRDTDADGIVDNVDFWDTGNGGLLVRIELFELIAGSCDFLSNCEPSFRLQVDTDRDGVLDLSRRADFQDFLDTEPLVNPVSWTLDIPDDASAIDMTVFVRELDLRLHDEIDVHPEPALLAGLIMVTSPFPYVQFVTQGDQEPAGRLIYSVEAIGL